MQRRKRTHQLARIRVVGVGGGGLTAVNSLKNIGIIGVDFLTIDTDSSGGGSRLPLHIRIGHEMDDRQGVAGDANRGWRAATESLEIIDSALYGSDLVCIVGGLGGGTGTGAAPAVAQLASQQGALVMAMVTYPFPFEDQSRLATAQKGIAALRNWCDTLIVIPNDRLMHLARGKVGFHETYRLAHDIWYQSIQAISDLVNHSGLINVDFADVRSVMTKGGAAVITTGHGQGPDRAHIAACSAGQSDLLGISIDGAHGLLLNITGGPDISLLEVQEAAALITERAHPYASVIFGAAIDDNLEDEIRLTVIATGFGFARPGVGPSAGSPLKPDLPPWLPEPTPLPRSS